MNHIQRGNIIITDSTEVLIEYAQNRYMKFTQEAASDIINKVGSGMSLSGFYKAVGGLIFELNKDGKKVGVK